MTIGLYFELLESGGIPSPWGRGEWGGISGNRHDKSFSIVVDNRHTKIEDNPTIFRDGEFWGENGGNGGNYGKLTKSILKHHGREHTYQVLRQSDYISRI